MGHCAIGHTNIHVISANQYALSGAESESAAVLYRPPHSGILLGMLAYVRG